jgi:hypothetical protein
MAEIPNLAGVATQDLVEKIGTGRFTASYINWARSLNLLRQHASGWMAECVYSAENSILHKAPVGGYLLIRFRHIDGTCTSEVPQAVMDNRNAAIPYEKITARDITDTQRRGTCLAAAFTFGLAYELWAKVNLESGYGDTAESDAVEESAASTKGPELPVETSARAASEKQFVAAAKRSGLSEAAIENVKARLRGNWSAGIRTLTRKSPEEIAQINASET